MRQEGEPILILAARPEISAGQLDMCTHSQVTLVVQVHEQFSFAFNILKLYLL